MKNTKTTYSSLLALLLSIVGVYGEDKTNTYKIFNHGESVTNTINKELKHVGYSAVVTTLQQAKTTYQDSNWKNCIEYCLTIQDILKKRGIESEIEVVKTGSYSEHAIIRFEEKGRTITYSNGKVVPNGKYSGRKVK